MNNPSYHRRRGHNALLPQGHGDGINLCNVLYAEQHAFLLSNMYTNKLSKKSGPNLNSNLLYKMGKSSLTYSIYDFLSIKNYNLTWIAQVEIAR